MSSLRTLLGDVVGGGSVPEKIFYVYNNNRGINNGGCCCLWTVPAGIRNKYDLNTIAKSRYETNTI